MKSRCNNDKRKDAKYYHGKGITYCSDWERFEPFRDWALSNGYNDSLTLDRIDGDKDYSPENCRWITIQEQQRNRSSCIYFTHNGETKTLSEWARIFGIDRTTLHDRIYKFGYSFEEATSTKRLIRKHTILIEYDGKTYNQSQFAKLFGTSHKRLNDLRAKGYSVDEIVKEVTADYRHKPRSKPCTVLYEYKGETHSLKEWAEIVGIQRKLLENRICGKHWTIEQALTTPKGEKRILSE